MARLPRLTRRPYPEAVASFVLAFAIATGSLAADPRKVVRTAYPGAETSLDPAVETDEASGSIAQAIFDPLLGYDFLARPAKLVGNTA